MDTFLVYGAYGYTGELVTCEAVERGLSPVLAGRDPDRLEALATETGREGRAFDLDSPSLIADHLADVDVVCNCAGPFEDTAEAMLTACLETGTHYLDVTGEIAVFERLARADDDAAAAAVTVLPGVGFDVVPSDCLAAYCHERLPSATHLSLGIAGLDDASRGTARTMVRGLGDGGVVRRDGRIVQVPTAHRRREIDFGRGPTPAATIPWGDVSTAYHTTGIENVEVYMAMSGPAIRAVRIGNYLRPLLGSRPVQAVLDRLVTTAVSGPDRETRERETAAVWAEATDGERTVEARVTTPNPYALTADSAVSATERVLAEEAPPGFQTPAGAFGADFALELDGVERELVREPDRSE